MNEPECMQPARKGIFEVRDGQLEVWCGDTSKSVLLPLSTYSGEEE